MIISRLYSYIIEWKDFIDDLIKKKDKASNVDAIHKCIQRKYEKIGLFLKYQIMFDLFSASLQDSIQAAIIFYIFADLDATNGVLFDTNTANIDDKLLLNKDYDEWSPPYWILRIKLTLCFIFMFYKVFRAITIECNSCRSSSYVIPKKYRSTHDYLELGTTFNDDPNDPEQMALVMNGGSSGNGGGGGYSNHSKTNSYDINYLKQQHVVGHGHDRLDSGDWVEESDGGQSEATNNRATGTGTGLGLQMQPHNNTITNTPNSTQNGYQRQKLPIKLFQPSGVSTRSDNLKYVQLQQGHNSNQSQNRQQNQNQDQKIEEEEEEENKYNQAMDKEDIADEIVHERMSLVPVKNDNQGQIIKDQREKPKKKKKGKVKGKGNKGKLKKKNEKLRRKLLSEELNDYGDVEKAKRYLPSTLGDKYEEEWRKSVIKLIKDNKGEIQTKTMQPIMFKYVDQNNNPAAVVKAMNQTHRMSVSRDDNDNDDEKKEEEDDDNDYNAMYDVQQENEKLLTDKLEEQP